MTLKRSGSAPLRSPDTQSSQTRKFNSPADSTSSAGRPILGNPGYWTVSTTPSARTQKIRPRRNHWIHRGSDVPWHSTWWHHTASSSTNVEVSSTDPDIESGKYKATHTARHLTVDSILLKLIGYENPETLKVITNQDFKTKALTWRTFWPALYADEDRISVKSSVFLPTQGTQQTGTKCALASLATGRNYAAWAQQEAAETKKIKNTAIIEYLEKQPEQIASRIELIEKHWERATRTRSNVASVISDESSSRCNNTSATQ